MYIQVQRVYMYICMRMCVRVCGFVDIRRPCGHAISCACIEICAHYMYVGMNLSTCVFVNISMEVCVRLTFTSCGIHFHERIYTCIFVFVNIGVEVCVRLAFTSCEIRSMKAYTRVVVYLFARLSVCMHVCLRVSSSISL